MALNIKDPATDRVVRELASITGEGVTTAIRKSAEERLQRLRATNSQSDLASILLEIGEHCSALPDLDTRTPEEILGYDEHGLPH
jgi:antitoxin VapB